MKEDQKQVRREKERGREFPETSVTNITFHITNIEVIT